MTWTSHNGLWLRDRRLLAPLGACGAAALASVVGPATPPTLDGSAYSMDDQGAVDSRTVTISDGAGILWIGMAAQRGGPTINDPGSWDSPAVIDDDHDSEATFDFKVWSRRLAGSVSNPAFGVSAANDDWGVAVIAVAGASASSYIHKVALTTNGDSANPTCPSVTTEIDNCLILRLYAGRGVIGTPDANYPGGTTGIFVQPVAGAGDIVGMGAAYETKATAGSVGTAAFSGVQGSDRWIAATLALRP